MFGDGTDPNRNYDFHWGTEGCDGSSNQCSSEVFRGIQPWNEEAAALRDLSQTIRPVFNISFHSFGQLVILPYGCNHTAEDDSLRAVGHGIGDQILRDQGTTGYTVGTSPEVLYTTDGTSIDWMYARLGTFSYVIELNSGKEGFQPAYDPWRAFTVQALRPINDGQRGGWMYVLDRVSRGPSIFGHVRDVNTNAPIQGARIDIQQIVFRQGESPRLNNRFGRYQWVVLPGMYDVTFSADAYLPQTVQVSVTDSPLQLDIALTPAGMQ
jgi:hypothetical protein